MGTTLVPINSTMISVGLSSISSFFHDSISSIAWVVTIYLIVMAVTQPISGKLGDIYGYRTVYMWGLGLFFISSMACAFSFNLIWLIIFRSIQAVGGALITPNGMAIARHTVSQERLPKVLGILGMGMGLGAAVGPLLGSTLITFWGWKSIFWVNVPFLLFGFIAGLLVIPRVQGSKSSSLDILGSIYLAVSLTLLILLTKSYGLWMSIVSGILFILFSVLFILREKRTHSPLIDLSLFKNRSFTSSNVSMLASNFIMYTILLAMPLLLEADFHFATKSVGAVMSVFSLSSSIFGFFGGQLAAKYGNRKMVTWTFSIITVGTVLLLGIKPVHIVFYLVIGLIVTGIGIGLGNSPLQTAVLQSVSKELSGTASGIFSTFRYFGSIISSTLISIITGSTALFILLLIVAVLGIFLARGIDQTKNAAKSKIASNQ
ncbi:MFS transporter [Scopulibacillus daqui]|nr:MFS transporter [Scopulibacillus daqui]